MNTNYQPLRFYSLWAINGPLDKNRLFHQLDEFRRLGFDGVVFHPRFYPGTPPYLSEFYLETLSATILHAKSLGLRFWIYDENGWPSGTANGLLYTQFPEDTCQRLDLLPEPTGEVIASFQNEDSTWHLCVQNVRGLDCFNPEATRHFLSIIHDKYREGLSVEAFDHVEAFFTDEPESGVSWEPMPKHAAIPWSRHMLKFMRDHFGHDVQAQLPLLFTVGKGAEEFRLAYWELITDLFCQGFLDPYRLWCEKYGKLFVGHVKGEEHPLFQLPMVGSCQPAYRHFSIPGIDALERYPTNHFYPRQASSVAYQFGNGRCMVEANGGAGWGNRPEDLQRYLLWLAHQGMTDFVIHLSQYQIDSAALHDWPPSQPLHLSWREAYPEILQRVRQELTATPQIPRETLIIAPYRHIMETYESWELLKTNIHDGSNYPLTVAGQINARFLKTIEALHRSGTAYDITDERTFEEKGSFIQGAFRLGQASYASLVISDDVVLTKSGLSLISQAQASGVRVISDVPSTSKVELSSPQTQASAHINLTWSSVIAPQNAFLLEVRDLDEDQYTANFSTPKLLPTEANLFFAFADSTCDITLNDHRLACESNHDTLLAALPIKLLLAENTLTFRSNVRSLRPFVWLTGSFLVQSQSLYLPGPNATLRTEGPLIILPCTPLTGKMEFVRAGLPYAFHPIQATAEIDFPSPLRQIAFSFTAPPPDILHFSIDQESRGWVWGPDWTLHLDPAIDSGKHELQILCYPNNYNYYGPHHYYRGDTHVVSPDQIRGIRNFADPIDAPPQTHVPTFHFKPWSLPQQLIIPVA